jgi:hypothetical protein
MISPILHEKLVELITLSIQEDENQIASILFAVMGASLTVQEDIEILADAVAKCVKEVLVPLNDARIEELRKSSQN